MAVEELTLHTIDPKTAALYLITGDEFFEEPRRKFQINDLKTAGHYFVVTERPNPVSIDKIIPDFHPLSSRQVVHIIPNREWFLPAPESPDTGLTHADSIHGVSHAARVGVYAQLIAQKEQLDLTQTQILLAAALIHDTQRVDDRTDSDHGQRAADEWKDKMGLLKGHGIEISPEMAQDVMVLCEYHEKPAEDIPWDTLGQKTARLLKYFMVADALDRFRAPHPKWWPKEEYFDHDSHMRELFVSFKDFAKYFTLKTEYYRLKNHTTIADAITVIGREVGIVSPTIIERLGYLPNTIRRIRPGVL